ncbi:MAG: sigma-70 family RNA polymerase sigma factor [Candidatus Melainabacteria bacterium]|nr:MAG: sigma-70 family RNA polymerase sigma factor [Candidatus Melainabacteria bacterium]
MIRSTPSSVIPSRDRVTSSRTFLEHEPDDQALIDLTLGGDTKAFERLLRRYQKLVYNLLFQMVRSHEVAADLTQESFLKAFKSLRTFRRGANFKPWILRIATNSCLNYVRDNKQISSLDAMLESEPALEPVSSIDVEREVELKISQQELFAALEQLSSRQRNIFVLRYHNDMSYDDIASISGESVPTVKSMLFRIRDKLRKLLAEPADTQTDSITRRGGDAQ